MNQMEKINQGSGSSESSFTIGSALGDAWQSLSGRKLLYWKMLGLFFALNLGLVVLMAAITGVTGDALLMPFLINIASWVISSVFAAAILVVGVKSLRGESVKATDLFNYFNKAIPLCFVGLAMGILITVGLILLVIPGVYLAIGYMFAPALIADKGLGVWQALETSRKAVTKRWFSYFIIAIIAAGIIMLSSLPFGIGLIWTLPWGYNLWATLYRETFDKA